MHLTRRRLAALAATVSTMAVAFPVASASAAIPAFPTGLPFPVPSYPATGLPAFSPPPLSFTGPSVHIANVIGPTIIGSVVMEGPGAAGQVAAGAPQAISLLSTTAGPTVANGTP
jgi:hypothetical protein